MMALIAIDSLPPRTAFDCCLYLFTTPWIELPQFHNQVHVLALQSAIFLSISCTISFLAASPGAAAISPARKRDLPILIALLQSLRFILLHVLLRHIFEFLEVSLISLFMLLISS